MNIDKINLAIIKHLRSGRKSYKKIAEQLSVSENTVRARVHKLIDRGILEITGLVDPEAIDAKDPIPEPPAEFWTAGILHRRSFEIGRCAIRGNLCGI